MAKIKVMNLTTVDPNSIPSEPDYYPPCTDTEDNSGNEVVDEDEGPEMAEMSTLYILTIATDITAVLPISSSPVTSKVALLQNIDSRELSLIYKIKSKLGLRSYDPEKSGNDNSKCFNRIFDAGSTETDVDCGGPICPKCDLGKKCKLNSDCISNRCRSKVCMK